ncbi:MAG: dTDP-4-dehydrorhamnose reductase [Pricia sp.]
MKILVTGANGQLGTCIRDLAAKHPQIEFMFTDFKELNIVDSLAVSDFFETHGFEYCINCAAYTAVDRAEKERERCFEINAKGPKVLSEACHDFRTTLIHLSTDFVFDGTKHEPYNEDDTANPINVYGSSKLKGERYVETILPNHYIIRTSWVYSEYGNNFLKTMLRLGRERNHLSIVNDQIGTPTYARDLAEFILYVVSNDNRAYGLYNYSNEGAISWFDFAVDIFKNADSHIKIEPISSKQYPTPAQRPKNSALDKTKVIKTFQVAIPLWRKSLEKCFLNINTM